MSNKVVVPRADKNFTGEGGGIYGFLSWQHIEQLLRRHNQVRPGEKVLGLYADDSGIHFEVEKE